MGFSASEVFGREEGQKSSETMEMQKMFLRPLFVFCLPSASQEDANAKKKGQKEQALNQSAKQENVRRAVVDSRALHCRSRRAEVRADLHFECLTWLLLF